MYQMCPTLGPHPCFLMWNRPFEARCHNRALQRRPTLYLAAYRANVMNTQISTTEGGQAVAAHLVLCGDEEVLLAKRVHGLVLGVYLHLDWVRQACALQLGHLAGHGG